MGVRVCVCVCVCACVRVYGKADVQNNSSVYLKMKEKKVL
jgi:hypothetical protein